MSKNVTFPLRSKVTKKWFNVVLDLNGFLYVCKDAKSKGWSRHVGDLKQPQSTTILVVVGLKVVYVCPNSVDILCNLEYIAFILV